MRINFWKMSGAGNDFVVMSGLPKGKSGAALAKTLCDRRFGIGADGLIVMSREGKKTRLDYWNADGSAAFCGNGSRCGALWAARFGWVEGKKFKLETNRGILDVELTGKGRAQVGMPSPKHFRLGQTLRAGGKTYSVNFTDTGVPHAVVFVPNIDKFNVKSVGRELRFHRAFGKAGANVDFVQVKNGALMLRTYERGVEDETLACGTGAVAAAAVSFLLGKTKEHVKVKVRGGDTLHVSLLHGHTWLEGPGEIVYSGNILL
ncbi:MAG: diaminopimelate epimerase [Elusimicrobia bacterium]|nr:diaminopimelate epimerase [Elusimicrobiota bacterium]